MPPARHGWMRASVHLDEVCLSQLGSLGGIHPGDQQGLSLDDAASVIMQFPRFVTRLLVFTLAFRAVPRRPPRPRPTCMLIFESR